MKDVKDQEYGKGKIKDFFKNHPELADPEDPDSVVILERAYQGSCDRDFNRMHQNIVNGN